MKILNNAALLTVTSLRSLYSKKKSVVGNFYRLTWPWRS